MSRPPIADVVAQLDDETLMRTMLEQLTSTFPSFADAPPRVKATRDRLMRLVGAAPDLLEALEACLEFIPGAEVRSWPPGFEMKRKALLLGRAAVLKARGK